MAGRGVSDLIQKHQKSLEDVRVNFNPRAATQLQQIAPGSDLWQRERHLRLDASQLAMVVGCSPLGGRDDVVKQHFDGKHVETASTMSRKQREEEASAEQLYKDVVQVRSMPRRPPPACAVAACLQYAGAANPLFCL